MKDNPMPGHRLEIASADFFATPLRKLTVENNEFCGRTYILKGDKIVAVAKPKEARDGQ